MEQNVFFKELRKEGGRGSALPASHTLSFPDLVPPLAINLHPSQTYAGILVVSLRVSKIFET